MHEHSAKAQMPSGHSTLALRPSAQQDKTDLELSEVNGCFGRAAKVSMGSTRFNLEHGELHRVPKLMVNKVGSFDLSIK
jgi:hypothetical protein